MNRLPITFRRFEKDGIPEIIRIQEANLISNLAEHERADGLLISTQLSLVDEMKVKM
jgi:hypothetical protein